MTKRDVAIWFCRLWALSSLARSVFAVLGGWFGARSGPRFSGGAALTVSGWWSANNGAWLSYFLVAVFLLMFAGVIGNELAAEGDAGAPIASPADLRPLLIRCIGLVLLFSAVVTSTATLIEWGAYNYSTPGLGGSTGRSAASVVRIWTTLGASMMRILIPAWTAELIKDAVQGGLGFLLAFGPRIRVFLRPQRSAPREL